jgi:hypothetical protein
LRDELLAVYDTIILYATPSPTGLKPQISSPPDGTYVNASGTYLIGSSSPDKPLLINGKRISRIRGGYFSVFVPLAPGENVFVIEQDGKQYIHTIHGGTAPETP